MVEFPPYMASAQWYAVWLKSISNGMNEIDAIQTANRVNGIERKELVRCRIMTGKGESLLLSMAVEGGSRKLREINKEQGLSLSAHGNWRKNHLGALEALYGKTPFYEHIMSGLFPVFKNQDLTALSSFNSGIHKVLSEFLLGDFYFNEKNNPFSENVVLMERGKEIAKRINPKISIIDSLMHLGRESLLALFQLNLSV